MKRTTGFAEVERKAKSGRVIPVSVEFSADLLTPVSAFLRLSSQGFPAFLLESVEGGDRVARYSFLGVHPLERWVIQNGVLLSLDERGRILVRHAGNPLLAMGKLLEDYRSAPDPELPPFTGGAVGYLGYECAGYLEKIPAPETRTGPYDAHLMVFRSVIAFDHVKKRVILISNIFADRESLSSGYRRALHELEELHALLARQSRDEYPLPVGLDPERIPDIAGLKPALGKSAYVKRIGVAKEHIRRGDIFQCVLSDQFTFDLKTDPFRIYRVLRTISPSPYLYYLSFGDEVLLGASPEMLTRVSEGTVETCPIAGTRPRGRNVLEDKKLEQSLLASVKEKAEHLMLVDLGRNDLGRVSRPGSVRVRDFMRVERYSNVMHLVSLIEGRLGARRSSWDALASCFPAGTLSGAPKVRAMEIISRLEPVRRGPYGGAVVYCDFSGRLDSCITIRSLYVRGKKGHIQAGAGVVADSRADREYQEILNKTLAIRKAVSLAQGGGRSK